eukprot:COSAG02_NODE_3266_length_7057_cov_12.370078_1_plen_398_part_00
MSDPVAQMASCLGGHVENAASCLWYAQDLKQDADAGPFMARVRHMEMDPTTVMMVGHEGTRHPKCFVFLSALTAAVSLSSGAICLHATRSLSKGRDGVPDCPYEPSDIAGSAMGSRGRVDPFTAERWADAVDAGSSCAWAMLVCGGIGLLGTYQKANLVCKAAGSNKSTPWSVLGASACTRCIYFVCSWIEVVYCILFLRTYGNFRTLHSDDSEMPWLSITDNYDDCQDSDPELHQLARVRLVVVWLFAPVAFFYKWVLVLLCCCACVCGVAAVHDDRATAEARRDYSTAASDDAAIDDAAMLGVLGVLGASAASSASRDRDIEGAIAAGILGLGSAVASAGATRSEPAVVVSNTPGAPTIEESLEVDGAMSRLSSDASDAAFETPPTSPRGRAANP